MDSPVYFDIRSVASKRVLTREEEFFLFGRLRYLEAKTGRIKEEEEEIKRIIEQIIKCNIRFAASIAKKFEKKGTTPVDDLISLCHLGLLSAIQSFDHASGNKFITYAVWFMKNEIYKAFLEEKQTSAHFYNQISQLNRDVDISAASYKAKDELKKAGISEEQLSSYNFVQGKPISLDAKTQSSGHKFSLIETLPDKNNKNPEEQLIENQSNDLLNTEIDRLLDFRSAYIVKAIHGIGGAQPINLQKVGEDIGCSREMARKIYVDALKILRESARLKSIYDP